MVEVVVARGSPLSNKTKPISLSNSPPFTTRAGFPITNDLTTTTTTTTIHQPISLRNIITTSKQQSSHQNSAKQQPLYRSIFDESETFYLSSDNVIYPSSSNPTLSADSLSIISSSLLPNIQENDASFSSQSDDASSVSTCIASTQTDPLDYGQEDTVGNFTTVPAPRTLTIDNALLDAQTSTQLMTMMMSTMGGISPTAVSPCADAVIAITPTPAVATSPIATAALTDHPFGLHSLSNCPRVEKLNAQEIAQRRIFEEATEDAFFVADLGAIIRQHRQWKNLLPRVEPFYAVKCNSDPMILKTLYDLGAGFDCASRTEIDTVMSLGTLPEDIIYANPCKQASYIRHARDRGVHLMTFDNANELMKIKQIHPNAKLVLRVLTDDSRSMCRFGVKFGARPGATLGLLQLARDLGIEVVGVSFHVGSGCFDKMAFVDAVKVARHVFDEGASLGMNFKLLDIGGGFPGLGAAAAGKISFPEIASVLGPAIDDYFPSEVRVIAEPGRYYASGTYTLCVSVTSRRVILPHDKSSSNSTMMIATTGEAPSQEDDNRPSYMYYVNDGIYGSFNCLLFDHAVLTPKVLTSNGHLLVTDVPTSIVSPATAALAEDINNRNNHDDMDIKMTMRTTASSTNHLDYFESSLWGPTCDSIDCISKKVYLPELQIGDWISFENMGAYTTAAASTFNGFARSPVVYTNTELSFC